MAITFADIATNFHCQHLSNWFTLAETNLLLIRVLTFNQDTHLSFTYDVYVNNVHTECLFVTKSLLVASKINSNLLDERKYCSILSEITSMKINDWKTSGRTQIFLIYIYIYFSPRFYQETPCSCDINCMLNAQWKVSLHDNLLRKFTLMAG